MWSVEPTGVLGYVHLWKDMVGTKPTGFTHVCWSSQWQYGPSLSLITPSILPLPRCLFWIRNVYFHRDSSYPFASNYVMSFSFFSPLNVCMYLNVFKEIYITNTEIFY